MLKSASSPGVLGPGKMPFGPVVDSWVIPDDPVAMFEAGRFHQVPLMTGSNADDGRMFTMGAPWTGPGQLRRFLQGRFGAMAGEAEAIFGDQGRRRPQDAAAHVVTVGAFAYPARFSAQAVQTTGGRAYLYHFTRVPPHLDRLGVGALHGIEIAYVFGNPRQGRWATEADRRLSDTIQSYWVCFARNGDPNDPGLPHWPAYDTATDRHLELGDEIRVGAGLHARECDFFQRLSRMDRGRVDLTDGAAEPPDR
jgi:para-nitrobenzyl esterase